MLVLVLVLKLNLVLVLVLVLNLILVLVLVLAPSTRRAHECLVERRSECGASAEPEHAQASSQTA